MPIRFRCVYCNQLLGISRRKAGCIVRCTKCEGQLIVPDAGAAAINDTNGANGSPVPLKTDPGELGGLFEREDFDALLQPYQAPAVKSAVVSPPPPQQQPAPPVRERPPAASASTAPSVTSLMLSRKQLTIALVLVVCAVGFAFACGMWVGLAMK